MMASDWLLGVDGPIAMTILEYALSEMVIRLAKIAFPVIKTNIRIKNQFIFVRISTRRFEFEQQFHSTATFCSSLKLLVLSLHPIGVLPYLDKQVCGSSYQVLDCISLSSFGSIITFVLTLFFFVCPPFFFLKYTALLYNNVAIKCWSNSVGVLSQVHVR